MNSDPNLEALVAELKADLPSERDSMRLRTRLAALGIAAAHGVAGSAAAASAATTAAGAATGASVATTVTTATTATTAAAAGIVGAAQASISVMAIKTFAIALVAGAGVMSSTRYVQNELSRAEPVASVTSSIAPEVAPALAATPVARAAHEELAGRVERAASDEQPQAAPLVGTPTLARAERAEHAEKPGLAAPFVEVRGEARGPAPSGRDAALTANAAEPAPAVAPLVASGSNSMAAFAEPASAAAVSAPAASETAAPRATASTEPALEATTLRAETALIDRALSALRTSDTALATRLLSQHRARFPDGLLRRERERAERKLAELEAGRGAP